MALFHCNICSEALDIQTAIYAVVPQPSLAKLKKGRREARRKYPVLYLLHGLSDDYTIWQRRTSIERYADPLDLVVIMPAVNRSFYTDMAHGAKYWTYVSEELPLLARSFFPISEKREDTFVAGLSMGGYGAFKLALSHPDRFSAAASLSGALDITETADGGFPEWQAEMVNIFGKPNRIRGTPNDLFYLADRVAASEGPKPRLYQWCGTDDFLIGENMRFHDHAEKLGLDLTYSTGPSGHEWSCWDWQIQKVLGWIYQDRERKAKKP